MLSRVILYIITFLELSFTQVRAHDCEFLVGFENDRPFNYKNKQGVVVGSDADILNAVMKSINCSVIFYEIPWKRSLKELSVGNIDVVIGGKFLPEREKYAFYSSPYKKIYHWLYIKKSLSSQKSNLVEFLSQGLILGVVNGWSYPNKIYNLIHSVKHKEQIVRVSSFDVLPELLNRDRVQGIIANPYQLSEVALRYSIDDKKFVPIDFFEEELHFIFSRKSKKEKYILEFNNSLLKLIYTGKRDELLKKYNVSSQQFTPL